MDNEFDLQLDDPNLELDLDLGLDVDDQTFAYLVDLIMDGKVIPVIGSKLLYQKGDLNQTLIDIVARQCRVPDGHTTFSELVYDRAFTDFNKRLGRDSIYPWLDQIAAKVKFDPSESLRQLLELKQFPLIFTTSFMPVVEQAMQQAWGDRSVRVLKFSKDPQQSQTVGTGDITAAESIKDERVGSVPLPSTPTVYYMFGRVSNRPHDYVVTDHDMLSFCRNWFDPSLRPRNLMEVLRGKYFLMLGNDYSDWLFRFIWYTMTCDQEQSSTTKMMVVDETADEPLIEFLARVENIMMRKSPENFIEELCRRVKERQGEQSDKLFTSPRRGTDVFISYSRADSRVAEALYNQLTAKGISVWYDRMNLGQGVQFMNEIKEAISTTKLFVPILTHNIELQKNEAHPYRTEWLYATQVGQSMGRVFIHPLSEQGFNFYEASIPEYLRSHNATSYDDSLNFSAFIDNIMSTLNSL